MTLQTYYDRLREERPEPKLELEIVRNTSLRNCSDCGKQGKKKQMKRIKEGWYCLECSIKLRKNHREYLKREVLGIRTREEILKEWKAKRERSEKLRSIVTPKIKGQKEKKKVRQIYFSITSVEKQFLYKKYSLMGWDGLAIKNKIETDSAYLKELVSKLRNQSKSEEEINNKFKEEFAKLIMENVNE